MKRMKTVFLVTCTSHMIAIFDSALLSQIADFHYFLNLQNVKNPGSLRVTMVNICEMTFLAPENRSHVIVTPTER